MERESEIGVYGKVDDYIFDMSYHTIRSIIYSAKFWSNNDDIENFVIPREKIDEWHDKLWYFDVTEWRPRLVNRAVLPRLYTNELKDVLERKAYELKFEIMDYLKAMTAPEDEEKFVEKEYFTL
jgi:hypothetical protein